MDTLLRDIRHALRSLRRSPGFTLVALLCLALGLGANIAIFTVIDGVLLQPLPYRDPSRLVRIFDVNAKSSIFTGSFSPQDFDDLVRGSHDAYASVGAYLFTPGMSGMNLTGSGEPERVGDALVSADFFRTLGVPAARGRTLRPEENVPGADREVVLSDGFWRRRFGADPRVVGRTVTLDGQPFTIVGVMPASFRFPAGDPDVWAPISLITDDDIPHIRSLRWMEVVARLRPGVSVATAQSQTTALLARLAAAYPKSNEGWGSAHVLTLHDAIAGDVRPALLALLAAVALVLLIACTNLANLLLTRGSARQRELAVRSALGAGHRRLVQQLLTESVILALVGGALGFLVGEWGVHVLVAMGGSELPRADAIQPEGRVVVFAVAVTLVTAFLFGLLPALRAARADYQALRDGGRAGSAGRERRRVRSALVVAETALAMLLLAGAGLMMRSFWTLSHVDPGFNAERVLSLRLTSPDANGVDEEQWLARQRAERGQILQRLASLPGVTAVGGSKTLPLHGGGEPYEFSIPGRASSSPVLPQSGAYIVTPGYFRTLGIPLVRGRSFTDADRPPAPLVVIVNQAFAREYWPGESAVGKTVRLDTADIRIVGVAGDVRNNGLATASATAVYLPDSYAFRSNFNVFIRTTGDPLRLVQAARRTIHEIDPRLPISDVTTLQQVVTDTVARPRFFTVLVGLFGGLALMLAAIGMYGVISYTVRQRTHEIGIRMALGARQGSVLGMVMRDAFVLTALGIAIGLAGALLLTRFLSSLLYGVAPTDAATLVVTALVLCVVAGFASWLPARRATHVDPVIALRDE
ncbi:MAG TPA: ABC transporter permease [Gemmatimonadaceae bacterium]|nr:ABC transporter permease [Gemmatimonadaceae bacterium]